MTTTQKIEMSREIRQWIGIAITALGSAYIINPEGTKDFLTNAKQAIIPKKED